MFLKTNTSRYKGKIYTSKLLCESYWENGVSKTRTILNISKLPIQQQLAIEQSIKDQGPKVPVGEIAVEKSIDYGWVAVILEILKRLRIEETFRKEYQENYHLAVLMILGKVVTRGSKLCIINWIKRNEFIAQQLGIDIKKLNEKHLYAVLSDLDNLQEKIEHKWSIYNRKRTDKIYLYDITSFYFEGTLNELSAYGYDRDKKKGHKKIITAGLVADKEGFPLKIQVFKGNMLDYKTVQSQIKDLKETFKATEIIFVGDRGMKLRYNLEEMVEADKEGVKYITGLTIDEIKGLVAKETIQLSLFDKELMEVEEGDKRYVLCVNPALAKEKQQKRAIKKMKFETELAAVQKAYQKEKERCKKNQERLAEGDKNKKLKVALTDKEIDAWKYRIRKAQEKYKMKKVYKVTINRRGFYVDYDAAYYEDLRKYDGKYVFETTVDKETLNTEEIRDTYKRLQLVEHAFKDVKTDKINARPIYHRRAKQTRGHMFVSMFAYAIIHEMEKRLYSWLREMKKTEDKLSFKDVVEELKTIRLCILSFGKSAHQEVRITKLTERQHLIFDLLGIKESILTQSA
jgi:transposase